MSVLLASSNSDIDPSAFSSLASTRWHKNFSTSKELHEIRHHNVALAGLLTNSQLVSQTQYVHLPRRSSCFPEKRSGSFLLFNSSVCTFLVQKLLAWWEGNVSENFTFSSFFLILLLLFFFLFSQVWAFLKNSYWLMVCRSDENMRFYIFLHFLTVFLFFLFLCSQQERRCLHDCTDWLFSCCNWSAVSYASLCFYWQIFFRKHLYVCVGVFVENDTPRSRIFPFLRLSWNGL